MRAVCTADSIWEYVGNVKELSVLSNAHTYSLRHVSSLLSHQQQRQRRLLVPYSMASDNNDPSKSDLKPLKYAIQNETLFHCVYFPFSLYMLSTSLSWYIFHTKKEKRTNAKIINNSAKKYAKRNEKNLDRKKAKWTVTEKMIMIQKKKNLC